MHRQPWRWSAVCLLAGAISGAVSCSSAQHLGDFDFRQKTLGVTTLAPSGPDVLTELRLHARGEDPLVALVRAGTEIARNQSAEQFRSRLDSAAASVDVPARMSRRLAGDASRHLRTRPVDDPARADFELEVRLNRYGIRADSWTSTARYLIDADLSLLDGATGRRIWKKTVRASAPVGTAVRVDDRSLSNVITAATLARMTTPEIERSLEELADFAADRLTRELEESLNDARN